MIGAIFGFGAGFLGSMPVTGPVALVVFRSSLRGNFKTAIRIVIGAAIAEVIYCALATFGYVQIVSSYPFIAKHIRYVGAAFLFVLGVVFMFQKVHVSDTEVVPAERRRVGFISGFAISILNPTLFLTWGSATSTIFSWFGSISTWDMVLFPLAAGVGIISWFAILLEILKKYRAKIGEKVGFYAIRGAAVLMLVSGVVLMTQAGK